MKELILTLENLVGEFDFALQEGIVVSEQEQERIKFLLGNCATIVNEMNVRKANGNTSIGIDRTAAKLLKESDNTVLSGASLEELEQAYRQSMS